MRALSKSAGCPVCVVQIDNTLEALQKHVGGYIETVTFEDGWCVICDEEGRLKNRPRNCEINGVEFVGKILIVGTTEDDFADVPFQLDKVLKNKYPQLWR